MINRFFVNDEALNEVKLCVSFVQLCVTAIFIGCCPIAPTILNNTQLFSTIHFSLISQI
jgi:hypothetical protein